MRITYAYLKERIADASNGSLYIGIYNNYYKVMVRYSHTELFKGTTKEVDAWISGYSHALSFRSNVI